MAEATGLLLYFFIALNVGFTLRIVSMNMSSSIGLYKYCLQLCLPFLMILAKYGSPHSEYKLATWSGQLPSQKEVVTVEF